MAAEALRDFLENGNIRNSVNFPDTLLPRTPGTTRIAVANRNVPNMVGQISTRLARCQHQHCRPAQQNRAASSPIP